MNDNGKSRPRSTRGDTTRDMGAGPSEESLQGPEKKQRKEEAILEKTSS